MAEVARLSAKELLAWTGDDPFREAILIKETPVAMSTFIQIKAGRYIPSDDLTEKLRVVMARHPAKPAQDPHAAP